MKPISSARRQILKALGGVALTGAAGSLWSATRQPVVVLTSYPDEVVSRVEAAFEKAYPDYRMQVVWRMPHDALPYLLQPRQGGIDVYWSASPRTFAAAKSAGAWRKLELDRSALPSHIGNTVIADPDGYYTATEVAGYGFAINSTELAKLGLPLPTDWRDLTDARYAGRIALPIPSRVGFAPPMVEIVLQAFGWDAGWALWSEIAGNARAVDRGATFVTDEVGSGRCVLGLSIDFFVASAISNAPKDSPLRFVYPRHNGINPGQIAQTAQSANPAGARAFTEFVLSEAGQKILAHPDLKKLPARPSVYASLPPNTYNPFAAAVQGDYDYDGVLAQPRLALSSALFQQMLVQDMEARAALWQRLHRAEATGKGGNAAVQAARRALSTPPLSEAGAAQAGLRQQFHDRLEGVGEKTLLPEEHDWRRHSQAAQVQADAELQRVGV
jgi:ABC-type Fe3+ transport system substrate-binding protein